MISIHYQVLISGGGIAGLTLALKLVRNNISVVVIEKETAPSVKYKGELLQPKSIEILANLDLYEKVHELGYQLNTTNITELGKTNKKVSFHYQLLNHRYNYALMVPHKELKRMILQKAQQYNHFHYMKPAKFISFTETTSKKKEAIIQDEHGKLLPVQADFFIGAEGRFSPIRNHLSIDVKETSYNHYFLTVSFPKPPSLQEGEIRIKDYRLLGLFPLSNGTVRTVLLIKPDEYKQLRKAGLEQLYEHYIDLCPDVNGYVHQIKSWKEIQLMIPMKHHAQQYVKGNCALIGDAVHSVHPMAGEGMNLAIQDADVLGELLSWMHKTNQLNPKLLQWYEHVRKPKAEFVSKLSHQSALAYSYSHPIWKAFRANVLQNIAETPKLHFKQMLNLSGLGIWKETMLDRFVQASLLSKHFLKANFKQQNYFFQNEDVYPWYQYGLKGGSEC